MALTPQEEANWRYLVAAVQNPQGEYVNAKSKRYASAIVAVAAELENLRERKEFSGDGDSNVQWL